MVRVVGVDPFSLHACCLFDRAQALLIAQRFCAVHGSRQRMIGDVVLPTGEGLLSNNHQVFKVLNERVLVCYMGMTFQVACSV